MRARTVEILLVEDNPGDARLAIEALKDAHVLNSIHHVIDGAEALAFLKHQPPYRDSPKIDVVLLDLNLPKVSGKEVLAIMRADPTLKKLPVIALTTSALPSDIDFCYEHGANAYMTKPVEFDQFYKALKSFECFWLSVVALPND
ncbi:MAG: response regulator [Magnetospirillum sp.]|nr:response regulator [Magnetospirillum sp.]